MEEKTVRLGIGRWRTLCNKDSAEGTLPGERLHRMMHCLGKETRRSKQTIRAMRGAYHMITATSCFSMTLVG